MIIEYNLYIHSIYIIVIFMMKFIQISLSIYTSSDSKLKVVFKMKITNEFSDIDENLPNIYFY